MFVLFLFVVVILRNFIVCIDNKERKYLKNVRFYDNFVLKQMNKSINIFGDEEDKKKLENRMLGIIMLKKNKKQLVDQQERLSCLFNRWKKTGAFKGENCVMMLGKHPQIWWWCEFEKKVREEEFEQFLFQQGILVKVLCRITNLKSLKSIFNLKKLLLL
jgi:hypothetical protein